VDVLLLESVVHQYAGVTLSQSGGTTEFSLLLHGGDGDNIRTRRPGVHGSLKNLAVTGFQRR
jgi:hypothetical protein